MTRRDRDLLNKQFKRMTPAPRSGVLILAVVGVFLVGIAVGGSLSAHENKSVPLSPKSAMITSDSLR